MAADTDDDYLTAEEVATRLGVSMAAIYRLLSSGMLPNTVIRRKRMRLIRPSDLDAFLKQSRLNRATCAI